MNIVRLLVINHTTKMGGAEYALVEFLRRLINDENMEVLVLLPDDEGPLYSRLVEMRRLKVKVVSAPKTLTQAKKLDLGRTILRQPSMIASLVRIIWDTRRVIRENRIQVVMTNSIKADIYGTIAASLAGCPVVWFIHDYIDGHYFPSYLRRLLALLANLKARKVLCNSNASRDAFQRAGVRASLLATVYPPIAFATVNSAKLGSTKAELGLPSDCRLVGLIGRITPPKGQIEFVEAAEIVARSIANVHFLIVGDSVFGSFDDAYKARLKAFVADSSIKERIHLMGMRNDVRRIVSDLDLFVCASQWPEGFGLTIAEAMDLSKPVVSTSAGGTMELVDHGETGLLVAPGNSSSLAEAIIELLRAPELARRMGLAGKQRIAHILCEDNCDSLRNILRDAALVDSL